MTKRWGGRRANQTGRPPKGADALIRVGMLYLAPDDAAQLAARARDGEPLAAVARRILIIALAAADSPECSAE